MNPIYDTQEWRDARAAALYRDGGRCTVARLLGGPCTDDLHVHHVVAIEDGGAPFDVDNLGTACSSHHPMWEALRRQLVRRLLSAPPRCPHEHRSREARRICEERLARLHKIAA